MSIRIKAQAWNLPYDRIEPSRMGGCLYANQ
jgi:hypothetical protein